MKNWIEIASHSELSAVQELKKSYVEGDLIDVEEGLTQLIDVITASIIKSYYQFDDAHYKMEYST